MDRSEGLEIVEALWRIVNGPAAGTTSARSSERVDELTARIRLDTEVPTSLHLKAHHVLQKCRDLFDARTIDRKFYGDGFVAGALARNAIHELRLLAERRLTVADREGDAVRASAVS